MKMYLSTCATSKDSDRPEWLRSASMSVQSDLSWLGALWIDKDPGPSCSKRR